MRKLLGLMTAVVATFIFTTFTASAAPIAAPKGIATLGDQVIHVAQGCGRFHHRNRWGRCVHN